MHEWRSGRGIGCCETSGELKKSFIRATRGGQLHAANCAGDSNDWNAGETEGRGVTQQTGAGVAVIRPGGKAGNGHGWKQNEIVLGQQTIHAGTEDLVPIAQRVDL